MKRATLPLLLVVTVLSLTAFAAGALVSIDYGARWVKGGLNIGTTAAKGAPSNRITGTVVADVDYDFPSTTIVCNDSWAVAAPGVKKGDPCFVGIGPRDGGVQIVTANSSFSCYSDADDTAKVRHCAAGTAANPADAGYTARFLSAQ